MSKIVTITISGKIEKASTDSVQDPVAVVEEIKWSINDGKIRLMVQYYESEDAFNEGKSPLVAEKFGLPREVFQDPTEEFFNSITNTLPDAVSEASINKADIPSQDISIALAEVIEEPKTEKPK